MPTAFGNANEPIQHLVKVFVPSLSITEQKLWQIQQRVPFKLRYRSIDSVLASVTTTALPQFTALIRQEFARSTMTILDSQPLSKMSDVNYYVLDPSLLPELSEHTNLVDTLDSGRVVLVRANDSDVIGLPVHFRAKLPPEILVGARAPRLIKLTFQPNIELEQIIANISPQPWRQIIQTMTLNPDVSTPGYQFLSRYALRVRRAIQHDGQPEPDSACDNSGEWIAKQFQKLGLVVGMDSFQHTRSQIGAGKIGTYTMNNIVATRPGRGPNRDQFYLLVAHYDSISSKTKGWQQQWRTMPAPGASDNASGVAILLEVARLVRNLDLDYSIRFIAFSGEELFLYGSKHYCHQIKSETADLSADQIIGVLNFDLIGHDQDGNLDIHVVYDERSQWLANAFKTVNQKYEFPLDLRLQYNPSFIYSDHSPFWEIGIPAVLLSEESSFESTESIEYIHSQADNMDKITDSLGELAVKLAVATTVELAANNNSYVPKAREKEISKLLWNVILFPNPVNLDQGESLSLDYFLSEQSKVEINLYNNNGWSIHNQTYRIGKIGGKKGRNSAFRWNGKMGNGQLVAGGVYTLQLTALARSGTSETTYLPVALVR